jgi:hypothetical protein
MRVILASLAAAVLLLALSASPAAANHSRGKCTARGHTIAKNDSGRVYEREQDAEVTALWGCLWSVNRPVELQRAAGDDYVTFESYDNVILRGRYVAWTFKSEDISCKADCPPGYDSTNEYVNVFDLRKRKGDFQVSDPSPGTLRLNTSGAAAWLTTAASGNYDVHAWDRDGHRTLDTGPIRRFRLRGPTLSWINGDVQHSVPLR